MAAFAVSSRPSYSWNSAHWFIAALEMSWPRLVLFISKKTWLTPSLHYCIYVNVFAWDARKALGNLRKHGVSFEEAATVFSDPEGLEWHDFEHSNSERRSTRIGFSVSGPILFVVYTIRRLKNDKETIRIISARQATRKERQAYAG